jgi:alpha-galactosidase
MIHTLENKYLRFELTPDQACWGLYSHHAPSISLEGLRMGVSYSQKRGRSHALDHWKSHQISEPALLQSVQGLIQQFTLKTGPDPNGLLYQFTFALTQDHPLLLWKLGISNPGPRPVRLDRLDMLRIGYPPGHSLRSKKSLSTIRNLNSPFSFFSNGWGSWNSTGAYQAQDRYRRTRLGFIHAPMQVNAGTPQPTNRGHFASDMFGVLGSLEDRSAILAGFLSQKEHFGSLETWIQGPDLSLHMWANGDSVRLDPGRSVTTDWACLHFLNIDSPDPLGSYLDAVARQHSLSPFMTPSRPSTSHHSKSAVPTKPPTNRYSSPASSPTGWCSWYQFFHDISPEDIQRNTLAAKELSQDLPLDIVQIDDGFQSEVGDWLSLAPAFQAGMAPLSAEILSAGLTPGLWLAPYIVSPRSKLASEHPEWLLRSQLNRPVNAGFTSWGVFATALDLSHPDALAYTTEVIHNAVNNWGFPYLKLDFLYAGALPGRYFDPTRSRAQILRDGLQAIRDAAGHDTTLLGCGCPLGSAVGIIDIMRIGADVDTRWRPSYLGIESFFQNEPDLPSARNAIQNTLTRASLHRRWWINDPDCLLLRPEIKLTLAEIQSLASVIALSGGSLLLSDDLSILPSDRLRIAQVLLPLIGKTPRILDWFDSTTPRKLRLDLENETGNWHLLALFNWDDRPRDLTLNLLDFDLNPSELHIARDFWSGKINRLTSASLLMEQVPPHGVALHAVRSTTPTEPQYLGSDLHISQGLEVANWRWEGPSKTNTTSILNIILERPGHAQGTFDLYLPEQLRTAHQNESPMSWQITGDNLYRFPVKFTQAASFHFSMHKEDYNS